MTPEQKWEYLGLLLSMTMVFLLPNYKSEFPKWTHYAGTDVGKAHRLFFGQSFHLGRSFWKAMDCFHNKLSP